MAEPDSPAAARALDAITSLLTKSRKARARVAPGTWQHRMLGDNVRALRLARRILQGRRPPSEVKDRAHAVHSLRAMAARAAKAKRGFAPGTAHHSLQRNRMGALQLAARLVGTYGAAQGRVRIAGPRRQQPRHAGAKARRAPTRHVP